MIDAKTAYFRYFTHRFQRICIRPNLGSIQINKIAYNRALSRIYSLNIKCYRLNVPLLSKVRTYCVNQCWNLATIAEFLIQFARYSIAQRKLKINPKGDNSR